MAKVTLNTLKKLAPSADFENIETWTRHHDTILDVIKNRKQTLSTLMKSSLFSAGCSYDFFCRLANMDTYDLANDILEQKKNLKADMKTLKYLRAKIKYEVFGIMDSVKRAEMKIEPKKVEVSKAGAFTVNYKSAMELISKLTKMVSDNMTDWKSDPERKMVIEFKSV